jgi:hypothetical protein
VVEWISLLIVNGWFTLKSRQLTEDGAIPRLVHYQTILLFMLRR